eukprot:SAG31_NODE_897_length_11148_cov_15.102815_12_plen_204_part_00
MSNAIETLRHALKEGCDIPRGQINVVHVADSVHGDHRHRLPKPWPVGESRALSQPPNKILVLGAQGVMGPPAVEALAAAGLTVRATDIGLRDPSRDPQQRARAVEHPAVAGVEYQVVDIADATAVARAAAGVHCIVNCAVSRQHRTNAFNVNVRVRRLFSLFSFSFHQELIIFFACTEGHIQCAHNGVGPRTHTFHQLWSFRK